MTEGPEESNVHYCFAAAAQILSDQLSKKEEEAKITVIQYVYLKYVSTNQSKPTVTHRTKTNDFVKDK